MPHRQKHRGANPKDYKLFDQQLKPTFLKAIGEYAFLLSADYPSKASLKLVGDKHRFTQRQRMALLRATCSNPQRKDRLNREKPATFLGGKRVYIDGYNQLITLEVLLSGGPVFIGMDNCLRDIASIHSTYRKVEETIPALTMMGNFLESLQTKKITWVLDQPISNSGMLKKMMLEIAEENKWSWEVLLEHNPDKFLIAQQSLCISTDSWILDRTTSWFNLLARMVMEQEFSNAWLLDFSDVGMGYQKPAF